MDAEQLSINPDLRILPFLRSFLVIHATFARTSDGVQSKNSLLELKELGTVYINLASFKSVVDSV